MQRLMTPEALDFVTQTSIATVKGFEERAPKAEFRRVHATLAYSLACAGAFPRCCQTVILRRGLDSHPAAGSLETLC